MTRMKVFTRLEELAGHPQPKAVAVGNFDGVHLGHRKILKCLVRQARRRKMFSLLLTFSPHPERALGKGQVLMIQTLSQRLEEVGLSGVRAVLVMPFGVKFSTLSPVRFIERVLVRALKARRVYVSRNFHFGRKRAGTVKTLEGYGRRTKLFEVCLVPPVVKSGRAVSSSRIRSLLHRGKVEEAAALLGRPYEISGRVKKGQSRGKRLGFPTANIEPENELLPPGVFITETSWGQASYPSVTNVGIRPTFHLHKKEVESYILGFEGSLYGRRVKVRFLKRLRAERTFQDAQSLRLQVERDIASARAYFRSS